VAAAAAIESVFAAATSMSGPFSASSAGGARADARVTGRLLRCPAFVTLLRFDAGAGATRMRSGRLERLHSQCRSQLPILLGKSQVGSVLLLASAARACCSRRAALPTSENTRPAPRLPLFRAL